MPLLKKWIQQDAVFGIWQVTEPFEWFRSRLISPYPYDEELQSFKSETRKLEYVATRVLLHELYGKETSIGHHDSGKPFLPDTNTHLTISHTQGYIAIGICPSAEIGIDIEYRSDRVRRIQDRFLSKEETDWCSSPITEDAIEKLLLCWTAKETVYKVMNKEGVDFSRDITVHPFTPYKDEWFTVSEGGTLTPKEHLLYYEINERFACTWTVDR